MFSGLPSNENFVEVFHSYNQFHYQCQELRILEEIMEHIGVGFPISIQKIITKICRKKRKKQITNCPGRDMVGHEI